MIKDLKIIGFDADDTLWTNEPYFKEIEKQFCELLAEFQTEEVNSTELYKTEMQNLELYGYGVKGFVLSMVETAIRISNNQVSPLTIKKIITFGKDLINKPVIILDSVQDVLEWLSSKGYKLILATKGDLLHQQIKIKKSKLKQYFSHIEIMSDKQESDYLTLLSTLSVSPENFLMIGNSMKSDIIPVLNIGGSGIHIPFHTTWEHEKTHELNKRNNFIKIDHISEIVKIIGQKKYFKFGKC